MPFTCALFCFPTPLYWLAITRLWNRKITSLLCLKSVGLWYNSITHLSPGYFTAPRGAQCGVCLSRGWRQYIPPGERQLTVSSCVVPSGWKVCAQICFIPPACKVSHLLLPRGHALSPCVGQQHRLLLDHWQISEIPFQAMCFMGLVQYVM